MNSGQQQWNQARQVSHEAMRNGPAPRDLQGECDRAYQSAMQRETGGHPPTMRHDVQACQSVLKQGHSERMLQQSVAKHSPNIDKLDHAGKQELSGKVVAVAAKRNAEDIPREERQNVKPGHETHRGQESEMAAWMQKHNWSR